VAIIIKGEVIYYGKNFPDRSDIMKGAKGMEKETELRE